MCHKNEKDWVDSNLFDDALSDRKYDKCSK